MTAKPTLGILITYFNERELIRECVDSLLRGTEQPDEILIYDNGADEPAQRYLPPDLPLRILRGDGNKGPSYSRNILLNASRSDYVHFQDADDLFEPEMVARLRAAIVHAPGLVVNEITRMCVTGERQQGFLRLQQLRSHGDLKRFCIECGMSTQSGTARRELLAKLGGFDETLWHKEDVDVFFRMALADCSYQVIDEPLITIRQRVTSHSTKPVESALHSFRFLKKLHTLAVPAEYHFMLCEYAGNCGVWLHQAGLRAEAAEAIQMAKAFGRPSYTTYPPKLRFLAGTLGVKMTENLRSMWREMNGKLKRTAVD